MDIKFIEGSLVVFLRQKNGFVLGLLFSIFFLLSFNVSAGPQCINLFKIDFEARYAQHLIDYEDLTMGIEPKDITTYGLNGRIIAVVRERLHELGVEYLEATNERGQVVDFKIVASTASEFNRLALDLKNKSNTDVFISLQEAVNLSSIGRMVEYGTWQYRTAYNIGIHQFLMNKFNPRSAIHRHELRHLNYIQRVVDGARLGKIPLTAGGIVSTSGDGFPEQMQVRYTYFSKIFNQQRTRELRVKEVHYRDLLSFEELQNHLIDMQVRTRRFLSRLKNPAISKNDVQDGLLEYFEYYQIMLGLYERVSQLGGILVPETFFKAGTVQYSKASRPQLDFAGPLPMTTKLFSDVSSFFYAHNIVHGFYTAKSPYGKGDFMISMPLSGRLGLSMEHLNAAMDARIFKLSQFAKEAQFSMATNYIDLYDLLRPLLVEENPTGQLSQADRLLIIEVLTETANIFSGVRSQL